VKENSPADISPFAPLANGWNVPYEKSPAFGRLDFTVASGRVGVDRFAPRNDEMWILKRESPCRRKVGEQQPGHKKYGENAQKKRVKTSRK
jgi:hypothetical protein